MSTRALAVVAAVSIGSAAITYLFVGPPRELQRPASTDDPSQRLGEVVERLEELIALLKSSRDDPQPLIAERVADHSSEWRDTLDRLDCIEGALQQIVQHLEEPHASGRGAAPAPRSKNEPLVAEVSEHGRKSPKSNSDRYWAWTPREVHEQFGRPDFTKWDKETGCVDWGYWGPDTGSHNRYILDGGAIQFRFEAGVVKDVWP
jgi:hypothetical protein